MAFMYDLAEATRFLSRTDKTLARLIVQVGAPDIHPPDRLNLFEALMRSIVYQQLSGKAASTILGRVQALFPGRVVKPHEILDMPHEKLRGAGMSNAKVAAVKDLAQKSLDGLIPTGAKARKMSDEEILENLTQVRGIGEWTVQMVLMFKLGRPDILPVKDLGVRKGFMRAYGLAEMPTEKELMAHCEIWRPFRSVGSWYMWQAADMINAD